MRLVMTDMQASTWTHTPFAERIMCALVDLERAVEAHVEAGEGAIYTDDDFDRVCADWTVAGVVQDGSRVRANMRSVLDAD